MQTSSLGLHNSTECIRGGKNQLNKYTKYMEEKNNDHLSTFNISQGGFKLPVFQSMYKFKLHIPMRWYHRAFI